MKKIIIVLLFLSLSFCLSAETIILNSGKTIKGKIIERTDDYIKIEVYGVPITYYREDIKEIAGETVNDKQNKSSSKIPSIKSSREIFTEVSPAVVYFSKKIYGGSTRNIGSGFIVDSRGLIVTNNHVINYEFDRQILKVVLKDGSVFPIENVLYTDPKYDITILKINANGLPVVNLGDSDTVKIGEVIYCIGASLGLEYSFSNGVLSGVRHYRDLKWLQFTAPVSPGNSGGPLINSQGEIIGLVTWQYREGQNINFALAINHVKPIVEKYRRLAFGEIDESNRADYYCTQAEKILQEIYQEYANLNPRELLEGESYRDNRREEAISYFEKALELEPNSFNIYIRLADVFEQIGNREKAVELYKKAIELEPEHPVPYAKIGEIYSWENPHKAIYYYEKSINLDPKYSIDRYLELANVYRDAGRYREARRIYLQARKIFLKREDRISTIMIESIDLNLKTLFIKKWKWLLLTLLISSLIAIGFSIRSLVKRKNLYSNANKKTIYIIRGITGIIFMLMGIIITLWGLIITPNLQKTLLWVIPGVLSYGSGVTAVFIKKRN